MEKARADDLNILIVEDSEDDTLLDLLQIKKGGYNISYERVETAEALKKALRSKKWDIILCDYSMPHFNGLDALSLLKETGLDIPFIIISGTIGEEIAVEAMKMGAHDYIMKDNLQRLLPAVERELRESNSRAEKRLLEQKKKQAEEALRKSENRYRRITEGLTDYQYSVHVVNDKVIGTVQSQACHAVTGYTPEEFADNPYLWFNMIVPEDHALIQERLSQILTGNDIPPIEHRIIRKDGEIRWVCNTIILSKDDQDKLISYDGVIKDITERKKVEIEIARANRTLRMLSDSNQALIHIDKESELLNEICRIIVEIGDYRLAWIGFVEHKNGLSLYPVAYAGYNSAFIESAKVFWRNKGKEQSPEIISVRTGKPSIIRNIRSDTSFVKWYELTVKQDYKSMIALPLIHENISLGVIGIYVAEMDTFDEKEVVILKELAQNVSFGISSLRIKIQKSKAEKALHASEERFSAAFRFSPMAILIIRKADEKIVDVNEVFIKNTGFSRDEIIGYTTTELGLYANPLDRSRLLNLLKDYGEVESFEFETKTKNGDIRTVMVAATNIKLNEEIHYLSLIHDITERKKSEEKLRILNTALKAAANAIIVTDKNGEIIWINEAFTKLTGYTTNETIGHRPGELVKSGKHSKDFYSDMWNTILNGDIWDNEIINRRKNGTLYNEHMTITPVLDKDSNVTRFIAVKQDITEKKLAEQALQNSERKYRIVADNTYNWEFWANPDGEYIYCSPSCLRVTGYTSKEFIDDRNLKFEIIHPDYRKQFMEYFTKITNGREDAIIQYKIIHKNKTERWIEQICHPVFDTDDTYLGRRGSNRDITEEKEADRKILNAIISTEEKERSRFSQELHDGLGPMLVTVKMYFQWLAETSDTNKRKGITESGIQNINDAIQAVREISNKLSPRILDNLGLIPAMKNFIQQLNKTQKIKIRISCDMERRYNHQTEVTLYRIFSELITNTLKHADAKNIKIEIMHDLEKQRLFIIYNDDGRGFNLNEVIRNKKGMGLHNMKQRIETLNGIIKFDTSRNKPLTVEIELPYNNYEYD